MEPPDDWNRMRHQFRQDITNKHYHSMSGLILLMEYYLIELHIWYCIHKCRETEMDNSENLLQL